MGVGTASRLDITLYLVVYVYMYDVVSDASRGSTHQSAGAANALRNGNNAGRR